MDGADRDVGAEVILQLKSTFSWSLSTLAALLRQQLFFYRDLLGVAGRSNQATAGRWYRGARRCATAVDSRTSMAIRIPETMSIKITKWMPITISGRDADHRSRPASEW